MACLYVWQGLPRLVWGLSLFRGVEPTANRLLYVQALWGGLSFSRGPKKYSYERIGDVPSWGSGKQVEAEWRFRAGGGQRV